MPNAETHPIFSRLFGDMGRVGLIPAANAQVPLTVSQQLRALANKAVTNAGFRGRMTELEPDDVLLIQLAASLLEVADTALARCTGESA